MAGRRLLREALQIRSLLLGERVRGELAVATLDRRGVVIADSQGSLAGGCRPARGPVDPRGGVVAAVLAIDDRVGRVAEGAVRGDESQAADEDALLHRRPPRGGLP